MNIFVILLSMYSFFFLLLFSRLLQKYATTTTTTTASNIYTTLSKLKRKTKKNTKNYTKYIEKLTAPHCDYAKQYPTYDQPHSGTTECFGKNNHF